MSNSNGLRENSLPTGHYSLLLDDTKLLAKGRHKWVFRHPSDSGLLVKVINPDYLIEYYKEKPWFSRLHREQHYHVFIREFKEHLVARVHDVSGLGHIQNIIGIVDTNHGVGQVVEAVKGQDGALAPTLYELIKRQAFTTEMSQAVDRFLTWYSESDLIISDFRTRNFVYSEIGEVVAIDGFGNKNTVPLRSIRILNKFKNRSKVREFKRKLDAFVAHEMSNG